ncbi:MAG TPA: TA system VapC family ribonuclease toxin [Microbacterium sp.]|nr:TA system VapC family ribonuclease toxin [Microbacterium sp.]
MKIPDVNILVAVYRDDDPRHPQLVDWLRATLGAGERILLTPAVVSGFVRVVSNFRIFSAPMGPDEAATKIDTLLGSRLVSWAMPGPRHWQIFSRLCRDADAHGNIVSDAAIAAVAIEHSATLVTLDRDFARFPQLRWELPQEQS